MIRRGKKLMVAIVAASLLSGMSTGVLAADNDGWTDATQTGAAGNGAWSKWVDEWETIKDSPTQISLTPGKNASELNFAWYSKTTEAKSRIKISKNQDMSDATELEVTAKTAVKGYMSNKAVATGLEDNTTYYYSYEINGEFTDAVKYQTKDSKNFSFLYVGDPQIGSSSGNTAAGQTSAQGQDAATRNDTFNWNNTINTALKQNPNVSFMLSAGDQIQTRDKKVPSQTYDKNEIEYAGYLSPRALMSLPVATTIGNHDAPSGNYSFHFNNPNASDLGKTEAGGDYYYTYGNTLFIMLNTNNYNIAEHQELIEKAVSENKDAKWKVVTLHQDIYGSGEHSNEPVIANLRYNLIPIFEENNIDVVLTGHDHTYSRSLILKGGSVDESKMITDDEFDAYIEGETPIDSKYNEFLESIEDKNAVQDVTVQNGSVVDPNGILYMTANSASGSKYYGLVEKQQSYIASRWQENVPTYSTVDVDEVSFTINTYRTDNGEKIDNTFSIVKSMDKSNLNELLEVALSKVSEKDTYTTSSWAKFEETLAVAKKVSEISASTEQEIADAYTNLKVAMNDMQVKGDKEALETAIKSAQDVADKALVGTAKGEYSKEAKDALVAAIKAANEVLMSNDANQIDVDNALANLNKAVETFKSKANGSVVQTKPNETTKPTTGVQTGDTFNVLPLVIAISALGGLVFINKKKKKQEVK